MVIVGQNPWEWGWNGLSAIGQFASGLGLILVSIILGRLTYRISKMQIRLTEQNLKIDLYKRRYDIYKRLEKMMRDFAFGLAAKKDTSIEDLVEIRDEVVFLFDKEIHDYLLLIINNISQVNNYSHPKEADGRYYELIQWFGKQVTDKNELREKFKRYLDLSNYGLSKD